MRQSSFKPVQLFAMVIVLFFIAHACNKSPLSSTENNTTNPQNSEGKFNGITDIAAASPFNKKVGATLDGRTGDRWIAKFLKKNGSSQSYTLNNTYLKSILSQPGCVGISLYYAKDNNNKMHILPVGVNGTGKAIQSLSVSTMQGNISWATAKQWIAANPGAIDAHFFGSNTFDRLNQTPCSTIKVDFALNDLDKQQLLLSNTCQVNFTKQYEDFSVVCPPTCSAL